MRASPVVREDRAVRARPAIALCCALAGALVVGACTNRTEGVPADESSAPGTGGSAAPGLVEGDVAPDLRFTTLDGGRPALRGLADAVLVNFWATDCRICLAEAPEMVALRERLAPRGFELVSVAMPYDRPDRVLELVERAGWRHPVALDIDGAALAAFEPVPGTPTSFLVGTDGTVLSRWSGRTDFPALEHRLEALLPPPAPAGPAVPAPAG